jgi:hypothetical protein
VLAFLVQPVFCRARYREGASIGPTSHQANLARISVPHEVIVLKKNGELCSTVVGIHNRKIVIVDNFFGFASAPIIVLIVGHENEPFIFKSSFVNRRVHVWQFRGLVSVQANLAPHCDPYSSSFPRVGVVVIPRHLFSELYMGNLLLDYPHIRPLVLLGLPLDSIDVVLSGPSLSLSDWKLSGGISSLFLGRFSQGTSISPAAFDLRQCLSADYGLPVDSGTGESSYQDAKNRQNDHPTFKNREWLAHSLLFVVIGVLGISFGVYFSYIYRGRWFNVFFLGLLTSGFVSFVHGTVLFIGGTLRLRPVP